MINSKRFLILIGGIFTVSQCLATVMPTQSQEDWRYHISIKAMEKWLGRNRQKLNFNAQLGAQQDAIKYELDIQHNHPWSYGFNASKNSFHETKRKRTALVANFYYEVPLVNNFTFNPFIGAGIHHTKIIKQEIKLRHTKILGYYTQEYGYKTKVKRGLVYNVGAEGTYTFTETVYGSLGWHMQEFLNAKLNGKRYNEQKVYVKLGYCFK